MRTKDKINKYIITSINNLESPFVLQNYQIISSPELYEKIKCEEDCIGFVYISTKKGDLSKYKIGNNIFFQKLFENDLCIPL